MPCHKQKVKNGFTLLELIVVIVILGILVTVGLPVYEGVIIKAKLAEMYVTVAAIEKAEEMYFLEHWDFYNDPGWSDTAGGRDNFRNILGVDIPANAKFGYAISGGITLPSGVIIPRITARQAVVGPNICGKWIRDGWEKLEHPWAQYLNVSPLK